jgi:hypothetical protein
MKIDMEYLFNFIKKDFTQESFLNMHPQLSDFPM